MIFVPVSNVPESCSTKTFAYEFRHDSLRARYMSRQLDPDTFAAVSPEQWHDCDGDMIYRDWTWDGDDVELGTFHLPGIGRVTSPAAGEEPIYVHTDHLGTTRLITDNTETGGNPDPQVIYTAIFTAFGEEVSVLVDHDADPQTALVSGDADRYGYGGTHGYQSHVWHDDDSDWFPFQHVGARYYDPSTGRFLQRDPIGVAGGLNLYNYVGGRPMTLFDPSGLMSEGHNDEGFHDSIIGLWSRVEETIILWGIGGQVALVTDLGLGLIGTGYWSNGAYEFGDCTAGIMDAHRQIWGIKPPSPPRPPIPHGQPLPPSPPNSGQTQPPWEWPPYSPPERYPTVCNRCH